MADIFMSRLFNFMHRPATQFCCHLNTAITDRQQSDMKLVKINTGVPGTSCLIVSVKFYTYREAVNLYLGRVISYQLSWQICED
jgi:hypothetical protein